MMLDEKVKTSHQLYNQDVRWPKLFLDASTSACLRKDQPGKGNLKQTAGRD